MATKLDYKELILKMRLDTDEALKAGRELLNSLNDPGKGGKLGSEMQRSFTASIGKMLTQASQLNQALARTDTLSKTSISALNKEYNSLMRTLTGLSAKIDITSTSFEHLTGSYNLKEFRDLEKTLEKAVALRDKVFSPSNVTSVLTAKNIDFSGAFKGQKEVLAREFTEENINKIRSERLKILDSEIAKQQAILNSVQKSESLEAQSAKLKEEQKNYLELIAQLKDTNPDTKLDFRKINDPRVIQFKQSMASLLKKDVSELPATKKDSKRMLTEVMESETQALLRSTEAGAAALDKLKLLKAEKRELNTTTEQLNKTFEELKIQLLNSGVGVEVAEQELQDFKNTVEKEAVDALEKFASQTKISMAEANKLGLSLVQLKQVNEDMERSKGFFNNIQTNITRIFSLGAAMMALRRFVGHAWESIKELDEAFNQIAVVTKLSTEQLWDSFETYNKMAQQLGVRTVDAIKTSALYYQQGSVIHPINIRQ